jgi:hypothetical protein
MNGQKLRLLSIAGMAAPNYLKHPWYLRRIIIGY